MKPVFGAFGMAGNADSIAFSARHARPPLFLVILFVLIELYYIC